MTEVDAYARLAGVYDEIVVDPCFPLWAAYLDGLFRRDSDRVHTVLDVCCGTGLMAAELRERGYRVVGVDASAAMLARARALLGDDVELSLQTLPDLSVDDVFDAAISTFDGLNYLTYQDFTQTLAVVADCLRPGGWFVFDLHTDAMLAIASQHAIITGETDGIGYTITNEVDDVARTCASRILVTRDDDSFSEVHRQFFHSDEQVLRAITMAGLELVVVNDEYTALAASTSTVRATWVCRRPSGMPA